MDVATVLVMPRWGGPNTGSSAGLLGAPAQPSLAYMPACRNTGHFSTLHCTVGTTIYAAAVGGRAPGGRTAGTQSLQA